MPDEPAGYAPPGAPGDQGAAARAAERVRTAVERGRERLGERRLGVRPGHAAVAVVLALAGALFATSARTADGTDLRGDGTDLRSLVVARERQVAARDAEVARLHEQVDALTARVDDPAVQRLQAAGDAVAARAGVDPVSGPGLTVVLDDAPLQGPGTPTGTDPDVLVVHQQDLQAVVNALWAGGAAAVGLQDQRIISTSAVRCVGNVLRLQGRLYAPPYTVRAVGDPQELRAAVEASPAVRAYLADAARVGLGWDLSTSSDVHVPGFSGSLQLEHAQVLAAGEGGAAGAPAADRR